MNSYVLFLIILFYLAGLFYIAFLAEKHSGSRWVNNPYFYTLSLAVYCTAWTYYGSVGIAAESGVGFLPIYVGPVIVIPLWIIIMRKIIRISKQHKVSSIADFISLRYGNSRALGALITFVAIIGTVPYISLQLKAISETFQIMSKETSGHPDNIFFDQTFYIAFFLALFAAFYGTRQSDATEKHKGIVVSTAIESIIKLIVFLIIGVYVTYFLFNGTSDIYNQMKWTDGFEKLVRIDGVEGGMNWFFMLGLSMVAIFLLPRQFQMTVVENVREKHLKNAIWMFPLYLLLFNVFVIFIAWGGKITFGDSENADYYSILLPLREGNVFMAVLVFLGGLSAVISMVIVSTLALSTMVSNNLMIPYGFLQKFIKGQPEENTVYIKNIRRMAIFIIIISAYLFYIYFSVKPSLYSIGLISFVIIAQLAPPFFIGLFWNRGTALASIVSIVVGILITTYTLILPFTIQAISSNDAFIQNGFMGIEMLKPNALFGIDFLSPPAHAFMWSVSLNILTYLIVSVSVKGNYRERNYADMFIDISNYTELQDNALVWRGEAYVADIKNVLFKFLGEERTERAINLFFNKYDLPLDTQMADSRLINFPKNYLLVQ